MQEKDYISKIDEKAERRFFTDEVELRQEGDKQYFAGYAVVFNSPTVLGSFSEEVDERALDKIFYSSDVRGLVNHNPDIVLGRNNNGQGTMILRKTPKGVQYLIEYNPADPDHVRYMEKVKRNDISQSSFAFRVSDQEITVRSGMKHRKITEIDKWIDVSLVTYPAYADTTVAARSLDVTEQPKEANNIEQRKEFFKRKYVK